MSRGQRELSIAQRRRKRHISSVRTNVNDLVGIPWKEERDLRKAIYDSLREQQVISSHSQRSVTRQSRLRSKRVSASARKPGIASLGIEESGKIEKKVESSISSCPHPRKSRPLPGSLSHAYLLTSSYLRSLASTAAAQKSLVRASSIAKSRSRRFVTHATNSLTENSSNHQILKRRSGVGRPSLRESESGVSAKVPREIERTKPRENVFEVLIEGDDGKFISQMSRINGSQSLSSTATLPPALWQDSQGLPVDTHDFVDFLCYYGTPCLSEKLAWFADPPSRRVFSASQMNGTKGGDSAGGVVGRKSALMTTTTNLITSPSICASPATAAPTSATLHKTPVFVARKTASIVSQPLNASAVTAVANDLVFTESPSNMSDPAPSNPKDETNENKKQSLQETTSLNSSPSTSSQSPTSSSTNSREYSDKKFSIKRDSTLNKKEVKSKTGIRLNTRSSKAKKSNSLMASVSTLHRSPRISSTPSPSNLRSGLRSQTRGRKRRQQRLRSF